METSECLPEPKEAKEGWRGTFYEDMCNRTRTNGLKVKCTVPVFRARSLGLTGYIPLVGERVKVCRLHLSAASNENF